MALKNRIKSGLYNRIYPKILPYKVFRRLDEKRRRIFLPLFLRYLESKGETHDYDGNDTYSSVVSVQGFGFSGSGAVLDLLCETDVCNVVGTKVNSTSKEDHEGLESDFLRLAGGLFEFEKYVGGKNVFQNDAMIKRFVRYAESFTLFKNSKEVQNIFFAFFDKIVDLSIQGLQYAAYNPYLYGDIEKDSIFFFRDITLCEYRTMAAVFLRDLFNYLNKQRKKILVFDQLLCDFEFDMLRYNAYIPGFKLITVYRDPRDVYAFACSRNIGWIAHDSVPNFIKWYRKMVANLDLCSNDYLVVQFESLINNYEIEANRIFDYLRIKPEEHIEQLKQTFLIPENSRKGIGIWKSDALSKVDIEQIELTLNEYCYNI